MEVADRRALMERYRHGYETVADTWSTIDEPGRDRRPAPGEWTAREIVHHLADSETTSYIRLRRLIAEDQPLIDGYDQDEFARRLHYDRPVESSLAVLAAVRTASLDLLETLDEDEWQRDGTHSEDGPYSIELWLRIYGAHPYDHADQMRLASTADPSRP